MRKMYRDVKDENGAGALASDEEVGFVADGCNCQRFGLSRTFTQRNQLNIHTICRGLSCLACLNP